jgi:hypothetical protein
MGDNNGEDGVGDLHGERNELKGKTAKEKRKKTWDFDLARKSGNCEKNDVVEDGCGGSAWQCLGDGSGYSLLVTSNGS